MSIAYVGRDRPGKAVSNDGRRRRQNVLFERKLARLASMQIRRTSYLSPSLACSVLFGPVLSTRPILCWAWAVSPCARLGCLILSCGILRNVSCGILCCAYISSCAHSLCWAAVEPAMQRRACVPCCCDSIDGGNYLSPFTAALLLLLLLLLLLMLLMLANQPATGRDGYATQFCPYLSIY